MPISGQGTYLRKPTPAPIGAALPKGSTDRSPSRWWIWPRTPWKETGFSKARR